MTDLKPTNSTIILDVNGLNTAIKRQWLSDCIKIIKKTQMYVAYKKCTLNINSNWLKVK